MERPLFGSHLLEAVQRQVDALAKADSGGPDEQECIGVEIIGSAQLPLQELILLRRKRSGKIVSFCGEILSANEVGLQGVAVGGQIVQQPAQTNEVADAG